MFSNLKTKISVTSYRCLQS